MHDYIYILPLPSSCLLQVANILYSWLNCSFLSGLQYCIRYPLVGGISTWKLHIKFAVSEHFSPVIHIIVSQFSVVNKVIIHKTHREKESETKSSIDRLLHWFYRPPSYSAPHGCHTSLSSSPRTFMLPELLPAVHWLTEQWRHCILCIKWCSTCCFTVHVRAPIPMQLGRLYFCK